MMLWKETWPMAKVVASYKDNKGVVRSARLLMGSVNRVSQKSRYLERPANKFGSTSRKQRQI